MEDLNTWFSGRPKWLQEAASLLLTKGRLADKDVDTLFDKCLREVDSGDTTTEASFPTDAFGLQSESALHLCSIGSVKGINALAPRSPLEFGSDNMTVVYGGNGSGKSGYVRILKHVCGARSPGTLHPNVFATDGAPQSANITYKSDGRERQVSWSTNDGVKADLRPVDIFDTECGRMYLEGESEVTYEPPALVFFSELIAVCDEISRRIDDKIRRLASKKPQMPAELAETVLGLWYSSLTAATTPEDVAAHTEWSTKADNYVTDLEKRLAEKAPADRAKELLSKKKYLEKILRGIESHVSTLSDENCRQIVRLKKDKRIKREAAQAAATKAFSGAPLKGIGTDAWSLLWAHARRYSEGYAYPDQPFPQLGSDAKCVLCHQPLSDDARKRLASFEEFVKGQAEEDARVAETALDDAMLVIGDIPTAQEIKTQCDAAGLTYEGDMPPLVTLVEALRQRKAKLLDVESETDLPDAPDFTSWLQDSKKKASEYAEAAQKAQEDATSDTRPQLKSELRELKARKWLFEQRLAVNAEIERLQAITRLNSAKRLTDTRGLSRKKGELAEELITEAYIQRFHDELAALRASQIKIELVKKRVDRGRVLHELRLANARSGAPREVLSEGEHRVVSLAAFLADVTGKQQPAPFVFDDPISSLDQDFEEAVVQRLVRLAADRQVIVFTHRVSLLVLLQEFAKREGREPKVTCVRSEPWGTGEPGDTPLFVKKPDKALNVLLNEHLAKARKVHEAEGEAAYALFAKSICSDFRILLERMIECELLADVVQRFRRAINTQGKLDKLARITAEDCRFLEDLMTKYSRYEHSQPNEAPVAPPKPGELKMDIEALRDWREAFIARSL
ncbi:AAA family ATPase [Lentisalinibacter salinarum]|uniref:AAA family ATPase n=1 Tax=Lentisalinibacter salinarum TaxID=2992239 RepID=UPI003870688A